jgi:threonylcarbamoyladenosine tRNA methylthiotransferase MtaB
MCRQYTASRFMDSVRLLNDRLDRPAITTDIIVGFPGETDSDFQQTFELAQAVGFAKMHIFPFSPRKGTPAYDFKDKIAPDIVKARTAQLSALDSQLQEKFRSRFIGQPATVIIESTRPRPQGRTERYFLAAIDSPCSKGDLVTTTLTANSFSNLKDNE